MLFEHANYRTYLRSVLAQRVGTNPAYSLRLFAHELGMAHSSISEVMKGKKNLSPDAALRIARKLELEKTESEYFLLLVQLEAARDPDLKQELMAKLSAINPKRERHDLSIDLFRVIADWYHYPILEMTRLGHGEFSAKSVAKRLGISSIEALAAIDRLLRLELLERGPDGNYHKSRDYLVARGANDEPAIKRFNLQMLKKAAESLETHAHGYNRLGGTETFPISSRQLDEAGLLMEEFFRNMSALSEKEVPKTDIYHLNVQFFSLTHEPKNEKSTKGNRSHETSQF